MAERGLIHGVRAPVRAGRAVARTDGDDETPPIARADDDVARPRRAVDEVPAAERPLLSLHDQQRLSGDDEEVLLIGLPVVHRHRLTGCERDDVDPELRELRLALEDAVG